MGRVCRWSLLRLRYDNLGVRFSAPRTHRANIEHKIDRLRRHDLGQLLVDAVGQPHDVTYHENLLRQLAVMRVERKADDAEDEADDADCGHDCSSCSCLRRATSAAIRCG